MICELVANFAKHVTDKVIHVSLSSFHHYYPTSFYYEEMCVCSFVFGSVFNVVFYNSVYLLSV